MEIPESGGIKLCNALKIIDMINAGASIEKVMITYFLSFRSVNFIMKHQDEYQNCLKRYPGLTINDTISIPRLNRDLPMDHYLLNWMRETFEAGRKVNVNKFRYEAVEFSKIYYQASFSLPFRWIRDFERRHNVQVYSTKHTYDPEGALEAVKKSLDNVECYGPAQFSLSFASSKLSDCQFSTVPDDKPDYSDTTKYDEILRQCALLDKMWKYSLSITEKEQITFKLALSHLLDEAASTNHENFFKKLLMNDDWAPFGKMMCSWDLAWTDDLNSICAACYNNVSIEERRGFLFFDRRNHRLTFNRTLPSRFCSNCGRFTRKYRQAAECSDCYILFWKYRLFYKLYRHHPDNELDD